MLISILLLVALARHVYGTSVTLGIPCIYEDLENLEQLNETIVRQNSAPDEIILVVSGADSCPALDGWIVICLRKRVPPGIARNLAWKLASSDVISFVDADDQMYPERIALIRDSFDNEVGLELLLHRYDTSFYAGFLISAKYIDGKAIYDHILENKGKQRELTLVKRIHHGHPSFRTTIACPKYSNLRRGEDVMFVRECLHALNGTRVSSRILLQPLTIYRPRAMNVIKQYTSPFGTEISSDLEHKFYILTTLIPQEGFKRIFQWSVGDSTLIISSMIGMTDVETFTGAHSSLKVASTVQKYAPRFNIRYVNIGPVDVTGSPIDRTRVDFWPRYSLAMRHDDAYDMYFVDGPFRVACVCQALLHGHNKSVVFVRDYTKLYHNTITQVAKIVAIYTYKYRGAYSNTGMAWLKRKQGVSDLTIRKVWEKYKHDMG